MCLSGDAGLLSLTAISTPAATFFPDLLEGDLLLTLDPTSTTTTSTTSGSGGDAVILGVDALAGTAGGVLWNVSGVVVSSEVEGTMEWTVFPAAGLLLPGRRCVVGDGMGWERLAET